MPNHWESSARPLFIKTVFVNGNRHAILFEKDPFLRCENSQFKKISRPNSSLSLASDLSIISSHSQNSNPESKTYKLRNINKSQQRDLSSELQSCLIKLKLKAGNSENKHKSNEEKSYCDSKAKKTDSIDNYNSKQKKPKRNHEKNLRKKHEQLYEEPNKYKLSGKKSSTRNSCYVYNLENYKGKKNYCFVKITSQPPQFVLNCSCGNGLSECQNCDPSVKNNMVISATIHNLIMRSAENENYLKNTFKYVFPVENPDIHWNDYLTRTCSLSERVFRWLELAKRQKQKKEILDLKDEGDFLNNTERIFSGKTFADEIKKREHSHKQENKLFIDYKAVNIVQSLTPEEEVDGEVVGEPNVETLLSSEELKNRFEEYSKEINSSIKDCRKSLSESELVKQNSNENSAITSISNFSFLNNPAEKTVNTPIFNLIKSPLKVQDLMLNCSSKENYTFMDRGDKKVKDIYNGFMAQEKEDLTTASINSWKKLTAKTRVFMGQSESCSKELNFSCDGNADYTADEKKEQILTDELTERNPKSIDNLTITRTRPLLIRNLSPKQQDDKKSHLQEEKIVWASEKNTGRPQLHIFMPSILLKDPSDDGISESENFLSL